MLLRDYWNYLVERREHDCAFEAVDIDGGWAT